MKRLYWFAILTILLLELLCLTACDMDLEEQGGTEEKTKLVLWTTPIMPESDMQEIVELYNEQSEQVEIEMVYVPFFGSDERINIAADQGELPNIYIDGSVRLGPMCERGLVYPLQNYITEEYDLDDIVPGVLDMCEWDDSLMVLPLAVNSSQGTLLINKTLFEEAGVEHLLPAEQSRSWSREMFEEAVSAIASLPGDVFGFGLAAGAYDHDKFLDGYIYNDGTSYVSEDGTLATYNSEENIDNFSWLVNLLNSGCAVPGSASLQDAALLELFLQERVAVINNNIGYCDIVRDAQRNGADIDLMIAHYPTWEGTAGKMWMSIYGVAVCQQGTKEEMEMAADFAMWLTSGEVPEVNQRLYVDAQQLPARKSLRWTISDPELQKLSVMPEQTIGNIFVIPHYQQLRKEWYNIYSRALVGELLPQDALNQFNALIQQALDGLE